MSTKKKRDTPGLIKIYEALGAIVDKRVHILARVVETGSERINATITSSSGNKTYTVSYNQKDRTIMANDNGSYRVGYLGYPSLAVLMIEEAIPYLTFATEQYIGALKGINRKQLNTDFSNDFEKTIQWVDKKIDQHGASSSLLHDYGNMIIDMLDKKPYFYVGSKAKPPSGW